MGKPRVSSLGVLFFLCGAVLAQTTVPREKIPANLPADLTSQIKALYSQDSNEVVAAAQKLGEMGPRALPAIPLLIGLLRYHGLETLKVGDSRFMVFDASAQTASTALAKIGSPAIEPLRAALRSENEDVRRWVCIALGRMKSPVATGILVSTVQNPASPGRYEAARGLGYSSLPRAVEVLSASLKDKDPKLRDAAATGLAESSDPRAVDPLLLALKDQDAEVRSSAAGAMANKKDTRVVPALIAALLDTDWRVRQSAALTLGQIKDPAAIGPVIELLAVDSDKDVRFRAWYSLKEITGEKLGEDAAKWRESWAKKKAT